MNENELLETIVKLSFIPVDGVVIADSEDEAVEMCEVGIEVKENGNLSARSDLEDYVVDYGAESGYDDIESVEEV